MGRTKIDEYVRSEIRKMAESGAKKQDIADKLNISLASAQKYSSPEQEKKVTKDEKVRRGRLWINDILHDDSIEDKDKLIRLMWADIELLNSEYNDSKNSKEGKSLEERKYRLQIHDKKCSLVDSIRKLRGIYDADPDEKEVIQKITHLTPEEYNKLNEAI